MVDGFSSPKKIIPKIADNAKFQFDDMQKVVCGKYFDEFTKFDYLKDRYNKMCGLCVSQFLFFPMGRVLLDVVFLSIKS